MFKHLKKNNIRKRLVRFTYPIELISLALGWFFMPLRHFKTFRFVYHPLFSLINKMFVRSFTSLILSFIFPTIIIMIVAPLFAPQLTFIGTISMIPMVVSVEVMPSIFIQLKGSSLLKRIGTSSIKTYQMIIAIMIYFIAVTTISLLINGGIGLLLLWNNPLFFPSQLKIGYIILILFYAMPLSLSFGVLLASLLKSTVTASGVGLVFILIGALVSGQLIPLNFLNDKWGEWRYFAYIFPQTYYTKLMFISGTGGNPFSYTDHTAMNFVAMLWYRNQRELGDNSASWIAFDNGYLNHGFPRASAAAMATKDFNKFITDALNNITNKTSISHPVMVATKYETLASLILPIIITSTLLPISVKTFKWQVR